MYRLHCGIETICRPSFRKNGYNIANLGIKSIEDVLESELSCKKEFLDKNMYRGTEVIFIRNFKAVSRHKVFESKWHWFIIGNINDDKFLNRATARRYGKFGGGKQIHWWPLPKSLL